MTSFRIVPIPVEDRQLNSRQRRVGYRYTGIALELKGHRFQAPNRQEPKDPLPHGRKCKCNFCLTGKW